MPRILPLIVAALLLTSPAQGQRKFRAPIWRAGADSTDVAGVSLGLLRWHNLGTRSRTFGASIELIGNGLPNLLGLQKGLHHGNPLKDELVIVCVYDHLETTYGLNLSLTGTVGTNTYNGLSIGGIMNSYFRSNGINFSIINRGYKSSGLTTGAYTLLERMSGINFSMISEVRYMKGIGVSCFANSTYELRGLQIGVYNKSKDTRGIQLGLWNVNERRSLPFVNWNFRPASTPQPADSSSAK